MAAELGSSVLIVATKGRPDPVGRVLDLACRVDGMVLMGRAVPDEVAERIGNTGLPLVLLARAGFLLAGSVIVVLPILVVLLALQRHFGQGIATTGLKS